MVHEALPFANPVVRQTVHHPFIVKVVAPNCPQQFQHETQAKKVLGNVSAELKILLMKMRVTVAELQNMMF